MSGLRRSVVLAVFLGLLTVSSIHAQQTTLAQVPSWVPNWPYGSIWPPVGFYVDSVSNEGRYITLEDSTIWEVQPTDRSGVAAWERDNFVRVHRMTAPNGDYEWLFLNSDQQDLGAAVRLAGRVRPKGSTLP